MASNPDPSREIHIIQELLTSDPTSSYPGERPWSPAPGIGKSESGMSGPVPKIQRPPYTRLSLGPCAVLLFLLATLPAGCAFPPRTFEWKRAPGHQPLNKSLAIRRFEDVRPATFSSLKNVAWLPLVPFGTTVYHQPGRRFAVSDPAKDFPIALAAELGKAQIFSSVSLEQSRGKGFPEVMGSDLILEGEVRSARIELRFFTYGVSFGCFPLWIVGLPQRLITLVLDVHMRIVSAETGAILWDMDLEDRWAQWQGLYYGRNFYQFPKLLARGALRTSWDLDRAAGEGAFGGGG